MRKLSTYTRRRCFISYHHQDESEVQEFIGDFDHDGDILISRGIGASMPGDVINSNDSQYIMRRIRELYLNNSTVTIVLVGRCTWARKYVDWEVAASLRNTANSNRNGLMAITLPSASQYNSRRLPERVNDNVDGEHGYARWWKYPSDTASLASMIEEAYSARVDRSHLAENSRQLFGKNRLCLG